MAIISKVFKKIVNDQLREYLTANKMLNNSQKGFRRSQFCQTALLNLSKILFDLKTKNQYIYVTALGYSRAFNTINFDILFSRIETIASNLSVSWFRSYLTDRRQYKICRCNLRQASTADRHPTRQHA